MSRVNFLACCAIAAMTFTSQVSANQLSVDILTAEMENAQVINWWERADRACRADRSGEINQACLDRTDLAGILEKRGFCWTIALTSGDHWAPCMVGSFGSGSNSGYFGPHGGMHEYNRFRQQLGDPRVSHDDYFTQGLGHDQSVSPSERR